MANKGGNKGNKISKQEIYYNQGKLMATHLLGGIQRKFPRFSKEMVEHYLDEDTIASFANTYSGKQKDFSSAFLSKFSLGEDLLTEKGKEIILRKSLQYKKGLGEATADLFNGFFPSVQERIQIKDLRNSGARGFLKSYIPFTAERQLLKEKYFDRTASSFADLYELMKTGDYARRMPDLAKAVTNVYDTGFFDAAAKILYEGKLLNPWKYGMLKRQIHKKAKEGVAYTKKSLEYNVQKTDYVIPQLRRTGVIIIGFIGLASLLANNSITGNVVGVGNPNIFGLLGGILLVISAIWLWFKASKKEKIRKIKGKSKKKKV